MRTCTFTGSSIAGRSDRCKPFPITKHLQLFYQNCIKITLIPEDPLRPAFFAQLRSVFHSLVARHVGGAEAEGQQLVHAALDEIVRAFCHNDIQLRAAELEQCLTADAAGRGDLLVDFAPARTHHGDVGEPGHALGHSLEQGRPLGAAGGYAAGATDAQVWAVPGILTATVILADNTTHTGTKRLGPEEIDLAELDRLNTLSRRLCRGETVDWTVTKRLSDS